MMISIIVSHLSFSISPSPGLFVHSLVHDAESALSQGLSLFVGVHFFKGKTKKEKFFLFEIESRNNEKKVSFF